MNKSQMDALYLLFVFCVTASSAFVPVPHPGYHRHQQQQSNDDTIYPLYQNPPVNADGEVASENGPLILGAADDFDLDAATEPVGGGASKSGAAEVTPEAATTLSDDRLPIDDVLTPPAYHHQVRRMSRREAFQTATLLGAGTVVGTTAMVLFGNDGSSDKRIAPVNFTRVAQETRINITLDRPGALITMDPITLQKKKTIRLPSWIPASWVPPSRPFRETTDSEVLLAAWIAGATMEMVRTPLLYPLLTLKTRVQVDVHQQQSETKTRLGWQRRLRLVAWNARRHFRDGENLFAGIVPTLLITAPATGLFYAVRDVSKRSLHTLPWLPDLSVAVAATLVGSALATVLRTPLDALAARLQVAAPDESVGNWWTESWERLPSLVVTEIPYLLVRIVVNGWLIQGTLDIGRYEVAAICSAVIGGILTTPFDVARTRMLVDSDNDPTNGLDGGSGEGLLTTFRSIVDEGGYSNLFRGWFERALYLGIGRAWLEPLQILGYVAVRDAVLLEWFN